MEIYIARELAGMLYALAVGASLGAIYDVVRISRLLLGLRPGAGNVSRSLPLIGEVGRVRRRGGFFSGVVVFLGDILFFAVATAIYVVFVFHANYGNNRWFFTFSAVAGFLAYHFTIGRLVMKASGAIRFALCAALLYLAFFALFPVRFALCRLVIPLARKARRQIVEKRTKKAKKRLDKELGFVYNIN